MQSSKQIVTQSESGTAGRSAMNIAGANVLGAVAGILVISVTTYFFGTGRDIEIYFAATVLFNVFAKLTMRGHFVEVLIPYFVDLRLKSEPNDLWHTAASFMNAIASYGLMFVVLMYGLIYLVIGLLVPGFSLADRELVITFFHLLCPTLVMMLISSVMIATLNADKRFGYPEVISVIAQLALLICLVGLAPKLGVVSLIVGVWVQEAVRLFGLFIGLRRIGYKHAWSVGWRNPVLRQALRAMRPFVANTLVTQGVQVFYSAILSLLPQGSYAVYQYAFRIYSKVNLVVLRPIPTVAFTALSESVTREDLKRLSRILSKSLRMFAFLALFISINVIIFSQPLFSLMNQWSISPGKNVYNIGVVLSVFAIGFILEGYLVMFRRTLFAFKRTGLVNLASIIQKIIGLAVFFGLVSWLEVVGAALANFVSLSIGIFMFWIFLSREIRAVHGVFEWRYLARLGLAATVAYAAARLVQHWGGLTGGLLGSGLGEVSLLLITGGVLLVIYQVSCKWLRIEEGTVLIESIRTVWHHQRS